MKACFIAFITSRFTDYDKIKAENKELRNDIYNLIKNEDKIEGLAIKVLWEIRFDMDDLIMSGSDTTELIGLTGRFS